MSTYHIAKRDWEAAKLELATGKIGAPPLRVYFRHLEAHLQYPRQASMCLLKAGFSDRIVRTKHACGPLGFGEEEPVTVLYLNVQQPVRAWRGIQ